MCVARFLPSQRVLMSSGGFSPHDTRKYIPVIGSFFFLSFAPAFPPSSLPLFAVLVDSCPAIAARPRRAFFFPSPCRVFAAFAVGTDKSLPGEIFARAGGVNSGRNSARTFGRKR